MSGVFKGVKKVFKKWRKVVKKIAKPVLIAAAVYFTAGVALSYFGPAGVASSLPGFASTGGMNGIFTTVANSIGLSKVGAAAATQAGAGAASAAVSAGQAAAVQGGMGSSALGAGALDAAVKTAGTGLVQEGAKKAAMSTLDKLIFAQVGTQALAGLTAPTMDERYSAAKKFRGSFYGAGEDGVPTMDHYGQPTMFANESNAPLQPDGPEGPGRVSANAAMRPTNLFDNPQRQASPAGGLDLFNRETPTQEIESRYPKGRA